MQNCELIYVRGGSDFDKLKSGYQDISESLYMNGVNVCKQTDIPSDEKKISEALQKIMDNNNTDYVIIANALTTTDSKSFKNLFYDFITSQEKKLKPDEEHKNETPRIKISSIGDMGGGYKGYCFKIYDKHFLVLPKANLCKKDNLPLIKNGLLKANESFAANSSLYKDGITYKTGKKEKQGFFRSLFPQKGDSGKVKTRKIVVLAAILVLIGAVGYLVNYFIIAPYLNNQVNAELQEIAYVNNDVDNNDDTVKKGSEQDWEALKAINDEIVGWIRIDDTRIDYPVLEHEGDDQSDQYYLYRTYKKDWSVYGSCFIDYRSTDSVNSKNVIIHGHNMNDGSMFHELMDYGDLWGDLDFYKEHPVIVFNTPEGDAKWKIISVFKTNTLYAHGEFFNYMQGEFNSDAEFMNFVYNCRIRSVFDTPVMVNEKDQLLTLSTCSYEFSNFRTVVVARKVRENEKTDVDVSLAKSNENTVYPDVYYERYGGSRPEVLTFKKAYEKGLISWYDGKGNLKGDETLTATVAANPTEPPAETQNKTSSGSSSGSSSSAPQTITFYTVNYLNYDGSIYETHSVQEGYSVPYPETNPTMPSDEYFDYVFQGWQTEGFDMDSCHYGMDIAPKFEGVPKQ